MYSPMWRYSSVMKDWQKRMISASRASAGVEVGAALAAADRHAGQGVLEDLLEAEELDDAEVDRGVEPQAALVGAERRVELHPEAAVDLDAAGVVRPRHAEDDLPLGLAEPLQDGAFKELRVPVVHRAEAFEDLGDRLVELAFAGIPRQHRVPDGFKPCVHCNSLNLGAPHWAQQTSLSMVAPGQRTFPNGTRAGTHTTVNDTLSEGRSRSRTVAGSTVPRSNCAGSTPRPPVGCHTRLHTGPRRHPVRVCPPARWSRRVR